MSDVDLTDRVTVIAPASERTAVAQRLLASARELDVHPREVRMVEQGRAFDVPTKVAERAKAESDEPYPEPEAEGRRTASATAGEWADDSGEPAKAELPAAEPTTPAGTQDSGHGETTTQEFGAGDVAGAETVLGTPGGEPAQT